MTVIGNVLRSPIAALALLMLSATGLIAQSPTATGSRAVRIGNFGKMDDNLYRGAQPKPDDYRALADLGIKTIVDLRNDPKDYEKAAATSLGIKYVNIPMSGWRSPKDEDIAQFLKITLDPASGPIFVHCKLGIHRTGVAGAVYRFNKYDWDYPRAYAEMKEYRFSPGIFHGRLKRYVKNYAHRTGREGSQQ